MTENSVPTFQQRAGARPKGKKSGIALHSALLDGLREMIVRGDLIDGEKLAESRLCALFGVSRTPLREALKALASEGLVTLVPNRGSVVAPIDPSRLAQVFEAKGALEHFIGLEAGVRASDADRDELDVLHQRLREAAREANTGAYTRLNHEIHARFAAATGNAVVIQLYARLQAEVLRARYAVNAYPDRLSQSFAEHDHIMIAFRARARLDFADRLMHHNAATGVAIMDAVMQRSTRATSGVLVARTT